MVDRIGFEPICILRAKQVFTPSKPTAHIVLTKYDKLRRLDSNQQDLSEDALTVRCSTNYAYCGAYHTIGSSGWVRTNDMVINSHLLYQLSY